MVSLREARISLSAIAENVASVAAGGRTLVDVSADAYGHGCAAVGNAAIDAGAAGLLAVDADDALRTRALLPDARVVVGRVPMHRNDELSAARIEVATPGAERVERDDVYGFTDASRPALTLVSRVISTKAIRAGDGVSYGYTYRAPRDGRTALVGIGYGDGVHRHAGNRAVVLVDDEPAPIVGRVAMNALVLFLGDRDVRPGAPVVLFGDPLKGHPRLSGWAETLEVHPASVTAGLTERVERIHR